MSKTVSTNEFLLCSELVLPSAVRRWDSKMQGCCGLSSALRLQPSGMDPWHIQDCKHSQTDERKVVGTAETLPMETMPALRSPQP
eukprot:328789-Amphidinium_carterae.1